MPISINFRIARQRVWAERKTVAWAGLALLSRLAPLSAVPIMLHFSTIDDADAYALILANAAIISIIMNFGQVTNMQSRFSGSGFSSIAIQGLATALLISVGLSVVSAIAIKDLSYIFLNLLFSLSLALTGQYNTLLRCSNKFGVAIWSELLRIGIFFSAVYFVVINGYLNHVSMSSIIILYYLIPYIFILSGVRITFSNLGSALLETWTDRKRLFYWTLAASLSAGAWVVIRYAVAFFGDEGDLAKFSAVMSICSAGVILTDLLYVRISRMIIDHTEEKRMSQVVRLMKVMNVTAIIGFAMLVALSITYIIFALNAEKAAIILSIFLSLGYLLRFYYVFGQSIMIARGIATYDLMGGVSMMVVAVTASVLLVPAFGIAGAGVAFSCTAIAMSVVIGWGVRRHWGEL